MPGQGAEAPILAAYDGLGALDKLRPWPAGLSPGIWGDTKSEPESNYVWFLVISHTIVEATMEPGNGGTGSSVPLRQIKLLLAEDLPNRDAVSPQEALAWRVGLPHDAFVDFTSQTINKRCKARIGRRFKSAHFWAAIFKWLADGDDGVARDCPWSELAHITGRHLAYSRQRQVELESSFRRAATTSARKDGRDFRQLAKDWLAILKEENDLNWSITVAALEISKKLPSLGLEKRYGNRLGGLFSDQGWDRRGYRLSFRDGSLRQAGRGENQGMVEHFKARNSDVEEVLIENLELPRDALVREFITKPDQECADWLQQMATQDMWTPNELVGLIFFDFDVGKLWRREDQRRACGGEKLDLGEDPDIFGNSGGVFHHILDDLLRKLRTGALLAYYRPTPQGLSTELPSREWADRFLHFPYEFRLFAHAKRILQDNRTEHILMREGIEIVGFDRARIFTAFPEIPQAFSDFAAELGIALHPPLVTGANPSNNRDEYRALQAAKLWIGDHEQPWQIGFKGIFEAVNPDGRLGANARSRIQHKLGETFPGLKRLGKRPVNKPADWKPLDSQDWRN